jgi:hypothetical protein
MTRGKPAIFNKDQGGRDRLDRKRTAEVLMQGSQLPRNPPASLTGMTFARAAWRSLMREHRKLPGELLSGLDKSFVIGYCLAIEARARALDLEGAVNNRYLEGTSDLKELLSVRAELRQATRLVSDLEKQIYGTPKSRAGVTPEPRKPEEKEQLQPGAIRWVDYIKSLEEKEGDKNGLQEN